MSDLDARRTRAAARSVALWVAGASAVTITVGVGILVAVILSASRQERREHEATGVVSDHVVVDVDRVLPLVIALGACGVVALGIVGWLAGRRAVAPLADALRIQREFVADASHELRTPLTALDSRIQILQRRLDRGEESAETVARLRRDAAIMNDTLTELLLAAEASNSPPATSDAGHAADEAVALVRPIAEEAGVRLRLDATSGLLVPVADVTLTRAIVALTDNAIQHSPQGSEVTVQLRAAQRSVEIRVSDHGTGIAPGDESRIFERFARGPESGRRRGFGLGLALVREVAVRAGGSIEVARSSSSGTVMLLTLPAARARSSS